MRRFSIISIFSSLIASGQILSVFAVCCLVVLVAEKAAQAQSARRPALVTQVLAAKNYSAPFATKEKAREVYTQMTKLIDAGSTDWAVYYVRAQALRALKKPDEAMADVRKSSALNDKEYFPVRLRGLIANDLLEDAEAIKYYSLALKMAPHERKDLLEARYRTYEKAGMIKEANRDLLDLLKSFPERNDDDKQRSLGKYAMRLGDPAAAVQFFTQALKMRATMPKVHSFRGDAYLMLKNYKAAIADYTFEIDKGRMNTEEILHKRAMAYRLAGDIVRARQDELAEKKMNAETYENMPFSN